MTTTVKPSNETRKGGTKADVTPLADKAEGSKGTIGNIIKNFIKSLTPTEEVKDAFIVQKQVNGEHRWIGIATNKWKDREGEILTDSAHVEFVKFLDENPEYAPELWTWHTPGTARKNKADWWEYHEGFFLYSGILTEEEAKAYEKDMGEPIGMSHGFYVLEKIGNYILKYRTFEVSELPLERAANEFTDFGKIKEENNMSEFSQRKRNYLVGRLGEEVVIQLETNVEDRAKTLQELDVDWKEINEQYEKEIEDALAEKVAKASQANSKEIVAEVMKAMNVEGLVATLSKLNEDIVEVKGYQAKIEALEAEIKMLKESEDERIAKALTPADPFDWSLAASTSTATVVKEENLPAAVKEEIVAKEFDWLKELNPLGDK